MVVQEVGFVVAHQFGRGAGELAVGNADAGDGRAHDVLQIRGPVTLHRSWPCMLLRRLRHTLYGWAAAVDESSVVRNARRDNRAGQANPANHTALAAIREMEQENQPG